MVAAVERSRRFPSSLRRLTVLVGLAAAVLFGGVGTAAGAPSSSTGSVQLAASVPALLPADPADDDKCTDGSSVEDGQCAKSKGQPADANCDGWGEPSGFCEKPKGTYRPDTEDEDDGNLFKLLLNELFGAVSVVAEWWIDEPGPDISGSAKDGGIAFARENLVAIEAFVVALALIIGAARLIRQREGRPAKDLVVGTGVFVAVSLASITIVDLFNRFCQDFATWYIVRGLGGNPDDPDASVRSSLSNFLTAADSSESTFVGIMAALCIFGTAIAQWLYKMYAAFIVLYLVATMPLMAAGAMMGGAGSRAFVDHLAKTVSWLLTVPLMSIVFVLSMQEYADAGTAGGTAGPYRGIVILMFGTIAVASVRGQVQGFLGAAVGSNLIAAGSAVIGAQLLAKGVTGAAKMGGAAAGMLGGRGGGATAAGAAGGTTGGGSGSGASGRGTGGTSPTGPASPGAAGTGGTAAAIQTRRAQLQNAQRSGSAAASPNTAAATTPLGRRPGRAGVGPLFASGAAGPATAKTSQSTPDFDVMYPAALKVYAADESVLQGQAMAEGGRAEAFYRHGDNIAAANAAIPAAEARHSSFVPRLDEPNVDDYLRARANHPDVTPLSWETLQRTPIEYHGQLFAAAIPPEASGTGVNPVTGAVHGSTGSAPAGTSGLPGTSSAGANSPPGAMSAPGSGAATAPTPPPPPPPAADGTQPNGGGPAGSGRVDPNAE